MVPQAVKSTDATPPPHHHHQKINFHMDGTGDSRDKMKASSSFYPELQGQGYSSLLKPYMFDTWVQSPALKRKIFPQVYGHIPVIYVTVHWGPLPLISILGRSWPFPSRQITLYDIWSAKLILRCSISETNLTWESFMAGWPGMLSTNKFHRLKSAESHVFSSLLQCFHSSVTSKQNQAVSN